MNHLGICELGRYFVAEHPPVEGRPVVWIGINDGDSAGEGGTFPLAEVEKLIADYYREHF